MIHCLIQFFCYFQCDTFLRTINIGSSVLSAKWISYITGNMKIAFFENWVSFFYYNRRYPFKRLSAFADILSIFIGKLIAKCLKHSNSTIICCASSNSNNEIADTAFHGICDHFTDTVSGCSKWIFFRFSYQDNSGSGSHFEDGSIFFCQISVMCIYRSTKRTSHCKINTLTPKSCNQGICGAFTTICKWFYDNIRIRMCY